MRKITRDAYTAFKNKKHFNRSNTKVYKINNGMMMELFGNPIVFSENENIYIKNGGWSSITTSERLSAFIGIRKYKNELIVKEQFVLKNEWINITQLYNLL